MKRTGYYFLLILQFLIIQNSFAESDSLKTYRLGEVVSESEKIETVTMSNPFQLKYYEIQEIDAASFSDLGFVIPSAQVRTNSRGETILYLRGAAERQLGLFFDGVLLNVPWDNRMDISLVPSDLIGNISIVNGASSVLYGANVLGGAVNISTYERATDGFGGIANLEYSGSGAIQANLTGDGKMGDFNYIANVTYQDSPGFLLPDDTDLISQKENSALRTNTDQNRLTAYLRGEYHFNSTIIGVSVNMIDAEKGVAPEGHLPVEQVRFWRYPEWRRNIITLNGEHNFSDEMSLRATLWYDNFNQEIDSYESLEYDNLLEKQKDYDNTLGARIAFFTELFSHDKLTVSLNAFTTKHDEDQIAGDETNSLEFQQNTMSIGSEYQFRISDLFVKFGGSFDYNETPLAGVFEDAEGNSTSDFAALAGFRWKMSEKHSLFANISRKTRFPTLREAFSSALNKFVVNPDLGAESGILTELGLSTELDNIEFEIAAFASFYNDMIAKRAVPGDTLGRSMRVNLSQARIGGLEGGVYWLPFSNLNFRAHLTYLYAEGKEDGGWSKNLEYRPRMIGTLIGEYKLPLNLKLQGEFEFTGEQRAENTAVGKWQVIDPTLITNARISYKLSKAGLVNGEVFIRMNNIFDTYNVSKLGLPDAGRTFQTGVSLLF